MWDEFSCCHSISFHSFIALLPFKEIEGSWTIYPLVNNPTANACLSIHPSIHPSIHLLMHPWILSSYHLSTRPCIHPSIHLSIQALSRIPHSSLEDQRTTTSLPPPGHSLTTQQINPVWRWRECPSWNRRQPLRKIVPKHFKCLLGNGAWRLLVFVPGRDLRSVGQVGDENNEWIDSFEMEGKITKKIN